MRGQAASGPVAADVVVIGGGAAGAAAALAARAMGREVVLIRRAWGATALSSGAADLAPDPMARPGAPQGEGRSIRDSIRSMASLHPHHPWATLSGRLHELDEALQAAEAATDGLLRFPSLDGPNLCLLTSLGTVKPTAGGQASMVEGHLDGNRRVGVVGFRGHPSWDAAILAGGIGGIPLEVDFLNRVDHRGLRPHEIARGVESRRDRFLESLRDALRPGVERLLLPPVMGEGDPRPLLSWLAAELDLPCAEWLAGRQSLPGSRLQRFLEEKMEAEGIRLLHGEVISRDGSVEGLEVRDPTPTIPDLHLFEGAPVGPIDPRAIPSWPVKAKAAVLATGKFIGGGVGRKERLREAVFDLPIPIEGQIDRGRWPGDLSAAGYREEQPIFRAGVRIDGRLRPLDAWGAPRWKKLFAAGAVLGGNDAARDGAGLGLAWFTGWLAGKEASLGTGEG